MCKPINHTRCVNVAKHSKWNLKSAKIRLGRGGETGRRARFRSVWGKTHGGSIPLLGTRKEIASLRGLPRFARRLIGIQFWAQKRIGGFAFWEKKIF